MSKIKLIKKAVNLSLSIAESLYGERYQNSMLASRGFTVQILKNQKPKPKNSGFVHLAWFHSVLI